MRVWPTRILIIFVSILLVYSVSGQEMFKIVSGTWLYKLDMNNCNYIEIADFRDFNVEHMEGIVDVYFHPDGRLYMTTTKHIIIYTVTDRRVEEVIPLSDMFIYKHGFNLLTINEEGMMVISDHQNAPNTFRELDLRNRVATPHESEHLLANNKFFSGINGIMPNGRFLMFSGQSFGNTYRLWDSSIDSIFKIQVDHSDDYSLQDAAIYFPACEPLHLIALGRRGTDFISNLNINTGTNALQKICPDLEGFIARGHTAHPTGFRQSPLRIDLDGDNSSRHIAAGYYDTLTTCGKEVPVMDDDVELYTCEAEVDYISFRLRYYDDPRLPEERIYSEGFTDPVETSPGRYVWQNPYGSDQEKIKEYLRSLRYFADWTDPGEKERVIMTTMHIGGDSTTSWSVYQLEPDEVFAGQDTTVTYCPENGVSLELTDYLTAGVKKGGRIEPELDAGGTVYTPGKDADGDYLYILQNMDCADTAVLTVESLETVLEDIGLDTVTVCASERVRIGFPPGKYDSIEWWDGNTGDSTWISADDTGHFVIVSQDGCGITVPITVIEQDVEGIAGRDTTIQYCAGGRVIDLTKILGLPDEYSCEIIPALSNGSLIFDPAVDATGTYQLVARIKGCTDTIAIVMEETMTQELVLDPVRLCAGTSQRIGLVQGVYDQVIWWNGDSGDSTTISNMDTGPFTVEAEKDGCTYQGEVDLTIVPGVVVPDYYPEQLTICAVEPQMIPVSGLDSVLWQNSIYYPGEEIMISEAGEYILRGYQSGCFAEKTITLDVIKDPSEEFSRIAEWCGWKPLTLNLPEDNANWRFRWADGTDSTSRTIDSTGRYLFLIISDLCEYTSFFEVVGNADCDEDCTVSIPNAITPNGDGINDNLEVFSDCNIQVTEIRIFDKWGGELYSVQGGEVEASGWADLPPGMVMVQVTYETGQGVVKTEVQGVLVFK